MKCVVKFTVLFFIVLSTFASAAYAADARSSGLQLPLHTSGHSIVDAHESLVRLISVNWYGFDEQEFVVGGLDHAPLATIVGRIRDMGFNSVRLPWANETLERNPVVPDYAVSANPQFRGKHAMEIMDAVIDALSREGIMVILDNHVSRADWCCKENDGNGLWANTEYPESQWIKDWQTIVQRYKAQRYVIGTDLRNELRDHARWGGPDPKLDWHGAAERAGNAILKVNPDLLIIVEGSQYSTDFREALKNPVKLDVAGRLVYSPHDYAMGHRNGLNSYEDLRRVLDQKWGYMLTAEPAVPIWVGEFGTCQNTNKCGIPWFPWFVRYLKENNLSWSYWPINGTQSSGSRRTYGAFENYGLLDKKYEHVASPQILKELKSAGLNPR